MTASAIGDPGAPAPISSAPAFSGSDASGRTPILFSPTRPGTPAATALEAQPVSGVVPATTYTVGKGDSLWTVAKKNHLKIADLCAANKLKPSTSLHAGRTEAHHSGESRRRRERRRAARGIGRRPGLRQPRRRPAASTPAAASGGDVQAHRGEARRNARLDRPQVPREGGRHRHGERDFRSASGSIPARNSIIPGGMTGAAKAAAGRPAKSMPAAEPAAPATPPANQDLDAGLKPAASTDVPVIKIDNGPAPPSNR